MQAHPLSEELFFLVGKLVPRVAVELVVLQKDTHKILLTRRSKDDPYWPSKWHIPGGYIWHRESIQNAITRISKRELNVPIRKYSFLGVLEFEKEHENPRNHTISLVYACSPARSPKEGKYFFPHAIPKDFIQMQQSIVELVKNNQDM
jgi:ADP-ribose pyrophosphatase YjhB (NUDIX family)